MTPIQDVGWRKATVTICALVCVTILGALGRLTPETTGVIMVITGAYLGVNLRSYRR